MKQDNLIDRGGDKTMCLGVPMQIQSIEGYIARCVAMGVTRDVNLFLLQDEMPSPGDFVMVHVGYAIQKVSPISARSAWELYGELIGATKSISSA